jgi:hypothetical protein
MYAGTGFQDFGCECGGTDQLPCIQTVETGWDIDRSNDVWLTEINKPHYFMYSTNSGYDFTGSCYDGIYDMDDSCPDFVWASETPFPNPGTPIDYSVVGSAPKYDLILQVLAEQEGFGSCTDCPGWWVVAFIYDIATATATGGAIGYYPFDDYEGSYATGMYSGTAEEFQAGGEVADGAEQSSGWTVPMGSGVSPTEGYSGNAAYVYNMQACTTSETCYAPSAIGPVTIPSNYSYSTVPAKGGSDWASNYFYLGDGPQVYAWTPYATLQNNNIQLYNPGSPIYVAQNQAVLAPNYAYNSIINEDALYLNVLGVDLSGDGYDHRLVQYNSYTGDWTRLLDIDSNDVYLWGVTTDFANGGIWGWDYYDNVWTNDGYEGLYEWFDTSVLNVSATDSSHVLATTYTGTCTSSTPSGLCIEQGASEGSFSTFSGGGGAWQVVYDSAPACDAGSCPAAGKYALDAADGNSGNVWKYTVADGWTQFSNAECDRTGLGVRFTSGSTQSLLGSGRQRRSVCREHCNRQWKREQRVGDRR